MKPRTYALSIPLIGVLAALLAGCASDPDRDGCDISALGTSGDSISLAAAVAPSRLVAGSLTAGADGKYVVASCSDGTCRWNAGGGAYEAMSETGYRAISQDLTLVARTVGCADIALVEVDGDRQVQRLEGLPNPKVTDASPVREIAFSPDGRLVAGAGLEGDLIIWSVEDGEEMASADLGSGIGSISFSPDGKLVAVVAGDSVSIRATDTGEELASVPAGNQAKPVWSPDSHWLAAVTATGVATIWDTRRFTAVADLPGYDTTAVAFSPDSRSLATISTADADGSAGLRLWAPAALGGSGSSRELASVSPEANVVFSPDGTTLYTASAEDGLAGWDVRTGKSLAAFDAPELSPSSTG